MEEQLEEMPEDLDLSKLEELVPEEAIPKEKPKKKAMSQEYKKAMLSTFIILFPALLLTLLVASFKNIPLSGFAIALFVFQAILVKNFVESKIPAEIEE